MRGFLVLALVLLWFGGTNAIELTKHRARSLKCEKKFKHKGPAHQPAVFNKYSVGDSTTPSVYHPSPTVELNTVRWHTRRLLKWGLQHVQKPFESMLTQFAMKQAEKHVPLKAFTRRPHTEEQLAKKAKKKHGGNILKLVNAVRGDLVFKTPADLEHAVCEFYKYVHEKDTQASKHHCKIVREKNRWTNAQVVAEDDLGYLDFVVNLECSYSDEHRPFVTEVRFHLCSVLRAKRAPAHSLGERKNGKEISKEWSMITDADIKHRLQKISRALYQNALKEEEIKSCHVSKAPFKKESHHHIFCDVTKGPCHHPTRLEETKLEPPSN